MWVMCVMQCLHPARPAIASDQRYRFRDSDIVDR